jgi:amino acid permease
LSVFINEFRSTYFTTLLYRYEKRGHFTAPDLYHSLTTCSNDNVSEDGADRSSVLDDFFRVSLLGFVSTIILNCLIMGFGFITFGGNSAGVILNNFSTLDKGATICRFLTAISVIGGYPFLISACRGEILELWKLKTNLKATRQHEKLITASLLLCVTGFAMIISDAGMIIGLAGAVMGSVLVYIFPSLLYLSSTKKIKQPISKRVRFERMFCEFLVVFGTFSAFAGISTIIPIGLV